MKQTLLSLCLCLILMVSTRAQTSFKTLNYLYSISGSKAVSGQHNDQKDGTTANTYTNRVNSITGKYPALYSGDFLFHGNSQMRWEVAYEAERQWKAGAMVNILWHACPPVQGNVCGWDGGLLSKLSDAQWNDLITDGGNLNKVWKSRIDEISVYLQYLEDKGVEVMWRPLHEMNQGSFWWGGRTGPNGTKKLYQLTHDYMKNVKGLSNLIWVWDVQDLSTNYGDYNPGSNYFDVAALDIYGDGYTNSSYYNALLAQVGNKPIGIGECFTLPPASTLQNQPRWSFFMNWSYGLQQNNSDQYIREVYNNPRVITRDEMPGWASVPSNLATGKPVKVSSTEAGANVASNAVDGAYASRWSSLYSDPQWIYVDLGANYSVNSAKITWEDAYGKDYLVQISSDTTNWTTLKTVTGNTSLTNDHTGLSGTGRYLRIAGSLRGTPYGYSIYELEVYGTPAVNQLPVVSLTAPANNASFVAPASVTLSANASDPDGTVTKVDFYSGSTMLFSDNTAPFAYTWTNVPAGTYTITAKATDNAVAGTVSAPATITVTTPPTQSSAKVVAYVANWVDLNSFSNNIDYSKLTHINIAFENPNSNGDLSFNNSYNTLIQRAHAGNVKVFISLAGGSASADAGTRNNYFSLISDSRRASFVSKLAAYVQAHNFDGIDVDLEGPAINGDYGKFITDLSNALKPAGKGLTSALSQGYGGGNVPSSTFAYFDWINIMAYDATGPWNPSSPGQHSSLEYAKSNLQYWLNRGLPKSKAVLGVPFYGYGFGAAAGEWSYSSIVNAYPGAENNDQAGNTIWYNGIPTIKAKTNYAFDQQIGGMMIWELSQDVSGAKSLLLAMDQVIKERTNNPVPVNLATGKPVTVSSTEVGANIPANAVDGSYATRWSSLYSDPQWLYVDLGATYDINRVKISWEVAYGKNYLLQVAPDAVNWTTIKTITNNDSLTNNHTGLSGTGRYLRIAGSVRGTIYGYSIYELEVYGTPSTPPLENKLPVVTLTAPANNTGFTTPASVTISASASDADGSVTKVDFYQGSTMLFSDNVAPFDYTWTNVPAGTYTITAKATDNSGTGTVSAPVTITVITIDTPPADACSSVDAYIVHGGYTAGSTVKAGGRKYECKPWPYSGWCNGDSWAYAPGSGLYWSEAWIDKGVCETQPIAAPSPLSIELLGPNPATDFVTLNLDQPSKIRVYNSRGFEVIGETLVPARGSISISHLTGGIYYVTIDTGTSVLHKTLVKN